MKLSIQTTLDYEFMTPTDLILQVEAAMLPEQRVDSPWINLSPVEHFSREVAEDEIGDRILLRVANRLTVDYRSTVTIMRKLGPIEEMAAVPPHQLPGPTLQYLLESRYCPSHSFERFVAGEFPGLRGGALIAAMRDYVQSNFRYVRGASGTTTTAVDTFVSREGVCRDYAHVMIALARAALIPARIASVYAPNVSPPDFHAVCEVFLNNEWHLVDATGMATAGEMAKIGVGRDAADIAFLTSFGSAMMLQQQVSVQIVND